MDEDKSARHEQLKPRAHANARTRATRTHVTRCTRHVHALHATRAAQRAAARSLRAARGLPPSARARRRWRQPPSAQRVVHCADRRRAPAHLASVVAARGARSVLCEAPPEQRRSRHRASRRAAPRRHPDDARPQWLQASSVRICCLKIKLSTLLSVILFLF